MLLGDAHQRSCRVPHLQFKPLLLFLLRIVATTLLCLSSLCLLPPDTAGTPATERRREREVDVLLRVETDNERWDVDDLLADAVM